jgi:YbgC/YbaW family acyl-CoA thioester hydrolase
MKLDTPSPHQRQDFRLMHRLRVRWAEVDVQSVVFNAHYLTYFDTAVTEYWRALGVVYAQLFHDLGGDVFVKKATLEFHASAEMDDFLDVGLRCQHIGNSSMRFVGGIFRGDAMLISTEILYVFAHPTERRALRVPAPLRDLLQAFEQGQDMVQVHTGSWQTLGAQATPLRREVFIDEQHVPESMELDEHDASALHATVTNRLGHVLATGRLLVHAPGVSRIGRMAVKKPLRGTDLGQRVLRALMQQAKARGDREVLLHAQCSAEGFYRRMGFARQGEVFEEAGIAHVTMARQICDLFAAF